MATRRGATGLAGVLIVDKPAGMTSHDVVARVRRATGEGRVGHAGTLDPAATGVLIVLVGPYTRLAQYLSGNDKVYSATIAFGSETDTDDAEGQSTHVAAVPSEVFDTEYAVRILRGFIGESQQQPPPFSAIKVDGKTSHEVVRAGGAPNLVPRTIVVHEANLRRTDAAAHTWDVDFFVSKGTYVRALARDIGRAVGSAAHLSALRRTRSGAITIDDAVALDTVARFGAEGAIDTLFPDSAALLGFPVIFANETQAEAISNGRALALPELAGDEPLYSVLVDGALRAVYRRERDRLLPDTVLGVAS